MVRSTLDYPLDYKGQGSTNKSTRYSSEDIVKFGLVASFLSLSFGKLSCQQLFRTVGDYLR